MYTLKMDSSHIYGILQTLYLESNELWRISKYDVLTVLPKDNIFLDAQFIISLQKTHNIMFTLTLKSLQARSLV